MEETFNILRDYIESWISVYDWKTVLAITFIVITFELFLLKICNIFPKKTPERKVQEESNSDSVKEEEKSFLKNLGYENWPHMELPLECRPAALSRSQLLSSLDPLNTEAIIDEMLSTSYDTWSVTSGNESQISWPSGSGSQLSFSSEALSSSSFLNSVHRTFPPNYRRFSHLMFETLPFSSRKLFPIKKLYNSQNRNVRFSSDDNFLRKSKMTLENDDLDLTPCPSAHLYLPRNQIRLLEENLRNQIPSKSQPVIKIRTTYQSSHFANLSQEPLYSSEETSWKREKMPEESLFHCSDLAKYKDYIKSKVFVHPQISAQSRFSAQTEVPGQVQDHSQTQDNINIQTSIKFQGLSKSKSAYYEKQEQLTTNFFDESSPILSLTGDETINPHILNIMENLNIFNSKEEQQTSVSSPTKHRSGIYLTDLKSTMGPRIMSLKAKKRSFSQILNIAGHGTTTTNRRKLEWSIRKTNSAGAMNSWNVSSNTDLGSKQASLAASSLGHSGVRTQKDMLRGEKSKFPQAYCKNPPEKISYAQALEKIPPSLENKGEFQELICTPALSSESSVIKMQQSKDNSSLRPGLLVDNKENCCPPSANKMEFLDPGQDALQYKNIFSSFSFPKKFPFQPEKAKKMTDVTHSDTFKISNPLRKKASDETGIPGCANGKSGKRSKPLVSKPKSMHPKEGLKSFLCSLFIPMKYPLQSEKQKRKQCSGKEMGGPKLDECPGAKEILNEVECKLSFDSQRVADLPITSSLINVSPNRAILVECDGSIKPQTKESQKELIITKQEEQQGQKCLPLAISKSWSECKLQTSPVEQKSAEIFKDLTKSVSALSCEENKRSLESHIKAADILQSIYSTVPSPSQIKIKYVKIMEDENNSVCIPLICEEIKHSESKVESEVDSKSGNATIPCIHPSTTKVADMKNIIPFAEIKTSGTCVGSKVDLKLSESNTRTNTTLVEIVADIKKSMSFAPVCEEIKLPLETHLKTEDFSESCITSLPKPCSTEDFPVCEEIKKISDDISKSGDIPFCESHLVKQNSLSSVSYEEKIKGPLGSHIKIKGVLESIFTSTSNQKPLKMKTVKALSDISSSVGEKMSKSGASSLRSDHILKSTESSTSLPPAVKKKSVRTLEDVKKSVCSPICDEIMKSLEFHIAEAISNSIDASTHSPHKIKKKSVEVVLDLKKSLFSLPTSEEIKRSLECRIKSGDVECDPGPHQKRMSQLTSDRKHSLYPPPVYRERQRSPETHIKIPPVKNWEIDKKTEKHPQQDIFLVKYHQNQIVADPEKEIKSSTHSGGKKTAFPKTGSTAVARCFSSQLGSISVSDRFTDNEKDSLVFHFQKKRLELKQGRIPTIVIKSYQKMPSPTKPYILKEAHCNRRVFPRCQKLNFMSQDEVDAIDMNLKQKYLMYLFGCSLSNQRSSKKNIPKVTTSSLATTHQKHQVKYDEKNMIVIKKETREELESHISEKKKWGLSNSPLSSFQDFIPRPPKNIYDTKKEKTMKRVISSFFIEGETRRSLPCHLRKMAAEQKCGIPSKLMKCDCIAKEVCPELCPLTCMKALIVNNLNVAHYINENIKQAMEVNVLLNLNQKPSYIPLKNMERLIPPVFQRFTAKVLKSLVTNLLAKSLEVKMSMIPKVVEESIKKVDNQFQRKAEFKSVYYAGKVTKPRSTILPFIDPQSVHHIVLNLEHKYLMFLLGLPIEELPPKLTTPPKYFPIPKLNKKYKPVNEVGRNKTCFAIDVEKLERHISFKKQNPYEIQLEESFILSVDSEYISESVVDRTIYETCLSLNCSGTTILSQSLKQMNISELSLTESHYSPAKEQFKGYLQILPESNHNVPDTPEDAPGIIDSLEQFKDHLEIFLESNHNVPDTPEDAPAIIDNLEQFNGNLEICPKLTQNVTNTTKDVLTSIESSEQFNNHLEILPESTQDATDTPEDSPASTDRLEQFCYHLEILPESTQNITDTPEDTLASTDVLEYFNEHLEMLSESTQGISDTPEEKLASTDCSERFNDYLEMLAKSTQYDPDTPEDVSAKTDSSEKFSDHLEMLPESIQDALYTPEDAPSSTYSLEQFNYLLEILPESTQDVPDTLEDASAITYSLEKFHDHLEILSESTQDVPDTPEDVPGSACNLEQFHDHLGILSESTQDVPYTPEFALASAYSLEQFCYHLEILPESIQYVPNTAEDATESADSLEKSNDYLEILPGSTQDVSDVSEDTLESTCRLENFNDHLEILPESTQDVTDIPEYSMASIYSLEQFKHCLEILSESTQNVPDAPEDAPASTDNLEQFNNCLEILTKTTHNAPDIPEDALARNYNLGQFYCHLEILPETTKNVTDTPEDTLARTDSLQQFNNHLEMLPESTPKGPDTPEDAPSSMDTLEEFSDHLTILPASTQNVPYTPEDALASTDDFKQFNDNLEILSESIQNAPATPEDVPASTDSLEEFSVCLGILLDSTQNVPDTPEYVLVSTDSLEHFNDHLRRLLESTLNFPHSPKDVPASTDRLNQFKVHFEKLPKSTQNVPDTPEEAMANTDSFKKFNDYLEILPEFAKNVSNTPEDVPSSTASLKQFKECLEILQESTQNALDTPQDVHASAYNLEQFCHHLEILPESTRNVPAAPEDALVSTYVLQQFNDQLEILPESTQKIPDTPKDVLASACNSEQFYYHLEILPESTQNVPDIPEDALASAYCLEQFNDQLEIFPVSPQNVPETPEFAQASSYSLEQLNDQLEIFSESTQNVPDTTENAFPESTQNVLDSPEFALASACSSEKFSYQLEILPESTQNVSDTPKDAPASVYDSLEQFNEHLELLPESTRNVPDTPDDALASAYSLEQFNDQLEVFPVSTQYVLDTPEDPIPESIQNVTDTPEFALASTCSLEQFYLKILPESTQNVPSIPEDVLASASGSLEQFNEHLELLPESTQNVPDTPDDALASAYGLEKFNDELEILPESTQNVPDTPEDALPESTQNVPDTPEFALASTCSLEQLYYHMEILPESTQNVPDTPEDAPSNAYGLEQFNDQLEILPESTQNIPVIIEDVPASDESLEQFNDHFKSLSESTQNVADTPEDAPASAYGLQQSSDHLEILPESIQNVLDTPEDTLAESTQNVQDTPEFSLASACSSEKFYYHLEILPESTQNDPDTPEDAPASVYDSLEQFSEHLELLPESMQNIPSSYGLEQFNDKLEILSESTQNVPDTPEDAPANAYGLQQSSDHLEILPESTQNVLDTPEDTLAESTQDVQDTPEFSLASACSSEKFYYHLEILPESTQNDPDTPEDAPASVYNSLEQFNEHLELLPESTQNIPSSYGLEQFNDKLEILPESTQSVPDTPEGAPASAYGLQQFSDHLEILPESTQNVLDTLEDALPESTQNVQDTPEFVLASACSLKQFYYHLEILPESTQNVSDTLEDALANADRLEQSSNLLELLPESTHNVHDNPDHAPAISNIFVDSKEFGLQKEEIIPEPQKRESKSSIPSEKIEIFYNTQANINTMSYISLQETGKAPDYLEINNEHLTFSPKISYITELQKEEKANPNDYSLKKTSSEGTEDTFDCQENTQSFAELNKFSFPSWKKMRMEMPFQTPNVIFKTFKKSWKNVSSSDGPSLVQAQKEIYFDIPFKLEEFSSWEKLSETSQDSIKAKQVFQEVNLSPQNVQASGSHSSLIKMPPNYKTHQHRKKTLQPKIHSRYWMSDRPLETQLMPYSLPRHGRLSRKTWKHVSCPLTSITNATIKVKLQTNKTKIILSLENQDGKKSSEDLLQKNTMKPEPARNFIKSKEKQRKKKKMYFSPLESVECHLNKPKSTLKHEQENSYFFFRRKSTQPFFYACIPADAPLNKSKTIRWTIPQNTSGQSKFRIPLVAKLSDPEKIWSL